MRLILFLKLVLVALCISLLAFGILTDFGFIDTLKIMALGTVGSIAVTVFYPDIRGIKTGDKVSVVTSSAIPGIMGKFGIASHAGRKNQQIKIKLENGGEVIGIVEDYSGIISPPKIRIIYEERLVD